MTPLPRDPGELFFALLGYPKEESAPEVEVGRNLRGAVERLRRLLEPRVPDKP